MRKTLRADFFVSPSGEITPKAPSLKFQERKRIWLRDNECCQLCGKKTSLFRMPFQGTPFNRSGIEQSNIDHIFPRSRGGQNDESNLRCLCLGCNMAKGAK